MTDKEKTINALKDFRKAYINLVENWNILNGTESIKLYPFEKSFDELEVINWIDETLKEI
jgi:hypothetical protein